MGQRATPFDLEAIFSRYKNKIYWLALGIVRNEKDAEDVTQNALMKIMNNLHKFRGQSSISTWIYRIGYNESLTYLRKKRSTLNLINSMDYRRQRAPEEAFVNWSKLPDAQLLDRELRERVNIAIRQMPLDYRLPLLLHTAHELSLKEGAQVMGLKLNSFKTRLHRANIMVRHAMADYFRDKDAELSEEGARCSVWMKLVYDYAAGDLAAGEEARFKAHLNDCPACLTFLDSYRQAIRVTRALQCRDLPSELKARINDFIVTRA